MKWAFRTLGNQYAPAIPIILAASPTYNSKHQMISNRDRHQGTWHFAYDFAGKLRADSTPAVLADGVTQPIVTHYQSADSTFLINPAVSGLGSSASPAATEPNSPWWAAITDAEGNGTAWTNDRWSQPLQINDPGSGVTTFVRNGGVPAVSITYPWGATDNFRYNVQGLLTWQQPAGQDSTHYGYGNNFGIADTITGPNQASQVLTLDGSGNMITALVSGRYTTHYYPDSRGRDTMVVDPLSHTTHYHYESSHGNQDSTLADGNRFTKRVFDQAGRDSVDWANSQPRATTLYDALNRVSQSTGGAMGDTTRFTYDSLYLVKVRDAKGQVYGNDVNALGWATRTYGPVDSAGHGIMTAYNRDGLPTATTNRRGQTVNVAYDAMGRVHTRSGTGVTSATYTYSANQRVVVGANSLVTDSLFVDSLGWTNAESQTFASGPHTFHINYRPTSIHQLDSVDVTSSPTGITFAGRKFEWDNTTGLLSIAHVNGMAVRYAYDNEAKLAQIQLPGAGVRDSIAYTTLHQIYQLEYLRPTNNLTDTALLRQYAYDSLGRMFTEIRRLPNGNVNLAYVLYDSLGHARGFDAFNNTPQCPSFVPSSGYSCVPNDSTYYTPERRTFDALGNELLDSVYAANSTVDTITATTYGVGNRIQAKGSLNFTTDADGNVTRKYITGGRDTRFGWSADGLMVVDTVVATSQTLQYDYDPFGRLLRRSRNGTVERYFLWSGNQLLAELDGTLTHCIAEYAYLPDGSPLALVTGSQSIGGVDFFAQDARGDVMGVTDSTSEVVIQSLGYGSQGLLDPLATSLGTFADTNRLRWKGLVWEGDSTRLYYARARWYDPEQGRFMSEDPIGLSGGINLYAFAAGDYINGTDPSGLDSRDCRPIHLVSTICNPDCVTSDWGGIPDPDPKCDKKPGEGQPPGGVAGIGPAPEGGHDNSGFGGSGGGNAAFPAPWQVKCGFAVAILSATVLENVALFASGIGEAATIGEYLGIVAEEAGADLSGYQAVKFNTNRAIANTFINQAGALAKYGIPATVYGEGFSARGLFKALAPGVNLYYTGKDAVKQCRPSQGAE